MRVLLDTNIVIHREAYHADKDEVGSLFYWLDRLHFEKCIHPLTIEEINRHEDEKTRKTLAIKIDHYTDLKTPLCLQHGNI